MKKYYVSLALLAGLGCVSAYAADNSPALNIITYQQTVKQWVKSDSAQVAVEVNATVKNESMDSIQQQIMKNLATISKGKSWHIDRFNVTKDRSGLETFSWQLSARLPWAVVNAIQSKVNDISKAGQQYKILSISFEPSLKDKQAALEKMRQQVYAQAKGELQRLNSDFSGAKYFLHKITFTTAMPPVIGQNVQMMAYAKTAVSNQASQASPGRKLTLNANIELASSLR